MPILEETWAEWLEQATAGIASNSLARSVRRELRAHLAEMMAAAGEGKDTEEAAREVLSRMGDPRVVGREWQMRLAGGGALAPAALALAALLQVFAIDSRASLLLSWLLVGFAMLASKRFRAWLRDAVILLQGVWSGTVSGITCGVPWSGPLRQVGPVGLATGLVAGLEPVWRTRIFVPPSSSVAEVTTILIVLGTPISVLAALAYARRSEIGVAPDASTTRGALALILGFVVGAAGGSVVSALTLWAIGFNPYPDLASTGFGQTIPIHPSSMPAYITHLAQQQLVPLMVLYSTLVLVSAWLTMAIAALRGLPTKHEEPMRSGYRD